MPVVLGVVGGDDDKKHQRLVISETLMILSTAARESGFCTNFCDTGEEGQDIPSLQ